ncbi:MAG: hypothetical protein HYZ27_01750 [Deltaproteobacteria bacterium]|nr:hypothetical protein [Deltaproteobacteria bacterium]
MAWERSLRLAGFYQLGVLVLAALAAWFLAPESTPAIAAAGLIMALNFYGLRFFSARILGAGRGKLVYGLALIVKMGGVMAALAFLVVGLGLDALGVGIGMVTLIAGIVLATLHVASAREPRTIS